MNTRNEYVDRIKRVESDVKQLKTNQTIGGDSWVVYKYRIDYVKTPATISKITFTPDIAGDYVATALWFFPDNPDPFLNDQDVTPDPNINGVWWDVTYAFSGVNRSIMVYSTKKGKVTMANYIPT